MFWGAQRISGKVSDNYCIRPSLAGSQILTSFSLTYLSSVQYPKTVFSPKPSEALLDRAIVRHSLYTLYYLLYIYLSEPTLSSIASGREVRSSKFFSGLIFIHVTFPKSSSHCQTCRGSSMSSHYTLQSWNILISLYFFIKGKLIA